MKTLLLAEIAEVFIAAAHAQVWCNITTVDTKNRPRSRVLHPIWEYDGAQVIGWVATGRYTLKSKHIEQNPYVSVVYMKDPITPTYAECEAGWLDDLSEKQRIYALLTSAPSPLGYDPAKFGWTPDKAESGLMKLTPWQITLADLFGETRTWRA